MHRRQVVTTGAAFIGLTLSQRSFATEPDAFVRTLAALDPQLRPVARTLLTDAATRPLLSDATLAARRADGAKSPPPPLPGIPVVRHDVAGTNGAPAVPVYLINVDTSRAPRPAILHTHGGGHVLGAARYELRYLQELARDLDCVVVTVEYRLSPDVRFAASVADTYAALAWLEAKAPALSVDRQRLALLGESAGGTHAALLALKARAIGQIPLCFQALIYPMLDDRTGSVPAGRDDSYVLWSAVENRYGWQSFLGVPPGGRHVPAAGVPARIADLSNLPPTYIAVGGADLFVDEDITYARRLIAARVPTELLVVPRAFHAFDRVAPDVEVSRRFHRAELDAFRRAFA